MLSGVVPTSVLQLQMAFWESGSITEEHRAEYADMFNNSCVMRCNTCEIYNYDALASIRSDIVVRPWLSRVGNSSWVMSFELSTAKGDASDVVAHASTVMVAVDAAVCCCDMYSQHSFFNWDYCWCAVIRSNNRRTANLGHCHIGRYSRR